MKKSTFLKFLDVLSSKLTCCLFSKRTFSKSNFLKFDVGTMLPFIFMALMLMNNTVNGQGNKQGDVPVVYPSNGFGVDGDAFAGHPKLYVGDWWASETPGSTGGSVFTSTGQLIPPPPKTEVAFFMDNFKTGDLNVFAESDKINDNPNTYDIKVGGVPPKDDMQRSIAVFTWGDPALTTPNYAVTGNANDLWCLFAADRWEVNGSSYIDFEFNQNAIIVNPDGTVTTEAPLVDAVGDPTGGRTPGDILITIEFTRGGGVGNLYVDKWSKDGLGQAYYWKTVDLADYQSSIFVTHNTVAEKAPWPIYDQVGPPYTYAIDQYAEGAINLTQIMGVDAKCGHFATVWTRTKSSHSPTAQLKDLGGITSLNVGAVPPEANCSTVNLPACTSENDMNTAFTNWKTSFTKTSGTGTDPVNATFDPPLPASLPANAGCGYTFTTTYTLTDDCGKTDSCTGTFTIAAPAPAVIVDKPDVVLEGCNPAWPSVVSTTYTFCNVEGTINGVAGDVQTDGCTQYRDYTFNYTDPCLNQAVSQVTRVSRHYDETAPVIVDKPDVVLEGCNPAWPTAVTTTYTDNCDAGGSINGVAGEVQTSQDGCTQYRDYTFNFTDSCTNQALTQTTRVSRHFDETAPVIVDKPDVVLEGCNPAWPTVVTTTYTDNCDAGGSINGVAGEVQTSQDGCTQYRDYTFNFTDSCTNQALTQTTRVSRHFDETAPVIVDKPDVVLEGCNPAWPTVVTTTYTDNCDAGGSINGVAGEVQSSQDGCTQYRDYTFNFTDSCTNQALTQTTRVSRHFDETAPVIVDKPDVVLEGCNPAWPTAVTTTYTDNCDAGGSINGVAGEVQTSQDGCTQYRDYTFNFTDSCLNQALTQVTRVSRHYDMTPPEITCSANQTIDCTSTPVFTAPTATDNCTATNDIVIVPGEVVIVNNEDGTVSHTMSWYAEDSCGNQSTSCNQVITVLSCNAHCTYTQGYYGNPGGMSCADGEQFTTYDLIAKALGSYGGTMTVGLPGQSVFMTAPEDIDDIIRVLPGGGGSYALLTGNIQISSSGFSSYLRKGNINNTLLAQTITLGLNLGIDGTLGGFGLQAGMDLNDKPIELATATPEQCGSDIPMPRGCSLPEDYGIVVNEYEYFPFPAFVNGMTVQELYTLANFALGGGTPLPDGVTLSGLASAVDMVNNAFDGCRISMGYGVERKVCSAASPQEFVAFEVPIVNNQLTIKYKFSYVSDVTIDVFDATTGEKLFSKADTNSYLDKEVKLDYNFNTGTQKVYIVRLTTRLGHDEQKVISSPY